MNQKQFIAILLALAVFGGAGLVLIHRNEQSWKVHEARVGDKLLPGFQINDVATIHVKGNGADFNIIHTTDHTNDIWCVRERDDYPADFALIRDFLFKVRDLTVVQSDLIGPSELSRLDLNAPNSGTNSATLIEFKDSHGQILAGILLGKKHPRPQNDSEPMGLHGLFDGRYILLSNDPNNALLVSDDLAAAMPDPGAWLSQDFFKAENVRFVSLVSTDAADSWEISRQDDSSPWVLSNPNPGEVLNPSAASYIGEILEFPTFDDVAPKTPALLASQGLDKPIVVTVLTDHFSYTLKVGHQEPDGDYPMTVNVEGSIPDQDADASELREKFAREQALAPWIYDAGTWIQRVIRNRSSLLEQRTNSGGQTAER